MAAWKKARRPRVMRPAAASDTSRITPRPERTPPLAYISITIAITSTITPAITCSVRLGSRSRAGHERAPSTRSVGRAPSARRACGLLDAEVEDVVEERRTPRPPAPRARRGRRRRPTASATWCRRPRPGAASAARRAGRRTRQLARGEAHAGRCNADCPCGSTSRPRSSRASLRGRCTPQRAQATMSSPRGVRAGGAALARLRARKKPRNRSQIRRSPDDPEKDAAHDLQCELLRRGQFTAKAPRPRSARRAPPGRLVARTRPPWNSATSRTM